MLRKFILFFIISALVFSGFAQKSTKKSISKAPKSSYSVMLINGEETPAERYCPGDTVLFDIDTSKVNILTYCWKVGLDSIICNTTPIKLEILTRPDYIPYDYTATLYFTFTLNTDTIRDTVTHIIHADYIRTVLDTSVCQGRNITVPTLKGDITFINVQKNEETHPDTLSSVSGCDSLIYWHIIMDPYIPEKHEISSCDSVVWGDGTNHNSFPSKIVVRRPPNSVGDTTITVERVFFATNPDFSCDTLRTLEVTIIDTGKIELVFDQNNFCSKDDMEGTIEYKESNFTAFDWEYFSRENLKKPDSLWTVLKEKSIEIKEPGYYHVYAYMDTSLYDTLDYLRIVATTCAKPKSITVEDCTLVIPNVFTPNGDGKNEVFGIKKLNLKRENELTIHDRWGKEVFRQKNYKCVYKSDGYHNTENAFDGHSRGGQKLPDGTYYYAFKYDAFPKSKKKTYVGVVVILRD